MMGAAAREAATREPVVRGAYVDDRDDDRERMLDAMLALAEQAMRACIEAGAGVALAARAERVLGPMLAPRMPVVAPVDKTAAPPVSRAPAALGGVELARVLGCLKAARTTRLSPSEQAANVLARQDVVRAMRGAGGATAGEVAA